MKTETLTPIRVELFMDRELHKELKMIAVSEGLPLRDLAVEYIRVGIRSLHKKGNES